MEDAKHCLPMSCGGARRGLNSHGRRNPLPMSCGEGVGMDSAWKMQPSAHELWGGRREGIRMEDATLRQ